MDEPVSTIPRIGTDTAALSILRGRVSNTTAQVYAEPPGAAALRRGRLFVLVEGLGEDAAARLTAAAARAYYDNRYDAAGPSLLRALKRSCAALHRVGLAPSTLASFGLTALALRGAEAWFAQLPPSQIYIVRQDSIKPIPDEPPAIPPRLWERFDGQVGSQRWDIELELFRTSLQLGDGVILCSSGLARALRRQEIAHALTADSAVEAATRLQRVARRAGAGPHYLLVVRYTPDLQPSPLLRSGPDRLASAHPLLSPTEAAHELARWRKERVRSGLSSLPDRSGRGPGEPAGPPAASNSVGAWRMLLGAPLALALNALRPWRRPSRQPPWGTSFAAPLGTLQPIGPPALKPLHRPVYRGTSLGQLIRRAPLAEIPFLPAGLPSHRRRIGIAMLSLLFVAAIGAMPLVLNPQRRQAVSPPQPAVLARLEEKLSRAAQAGDRAAADGLLDEAHELLQEALRRPERGGRIEQLQIGLLRERERWAVSARAEPMAMLAELPAAGRATVGPLALAVAAGQPYVLDRSGPVLLAAAGAPPRAVLASGPPGTAGAAMVAPPLLVAPVPGMPSVYVVSSDRNLWVVSGQARPERRPLPGAQRWSRPVALATYLQNAYVLDPGTPQIWRYAPPGGDSWWSVEPQPWLAGGEGAEAASAIDLAIDGAIYLLLADGQVRRYAAGRADQGFALQAAAQPLERPVALYTSTDAQQLYVLDGAGGPGGRARVVQFGKDGAFQRQLVGLTELPAEAAADLWVDEPGSRFWVLTDRRLVEYRLASR